MKVTKVMKRMNEMNGINLHYYYSEKPRQRLKAPSVVDPIAENRCRGVKPPTGLWYNLTFSGIQHPTISPIPVETCCGTSLFKKLHTLLPRQRLKALSVVDPIAENPCRGVKPPTGLLCNLIFSGIQHPAISPIPVETCYTRLCSENFETCCTRLYTTNKRCLQIIHLLVFGNNILKNPNNPLIQKIKVRTKSGIANSA